jgi:hypothetical protein
MLQAQAQSPSGCLVLPVVWQQGQSVLGGVVLRPSAAQRCTQLALFGEQQLRTSAGMTPAVPG